MAHAGGCLSPGRGGQEGGPSLPPVLPTALPCPASSPPQAAIDHRPNQLDQPEVKEALAHGHEAAFTKARDTHLDALSAAQGGRWLDADEVAREKGTGAHHHHPDASDPQVTGEPTRAG